MPHPVLLLPDVALQLADQVAAVLAAAGAFPVARSEHQVLQRVVVQAHPDEMAVPQQVWDPAPVVQMFVKSLLARASWA